MARGNNKLIEIRIFSDDFKKFRIWADKNQIEHSRSEHPRVWDIEISIENSLKWTAFQYNIPLEQLKRDTKTLVAKTDKKAKVKEEEKTSMADFINEL